MLKKVLIDIGHGGRDPGATFMTADGHQIREYDVNAQIAYDVLAYLSDSIDPSRISFIDPGAVDGTNAALDIDDRANQIVDMADPETLVLSLHMNKGSQGATGAEVIYLDGNDEGKKLATAILENYVAHTKLKSRGVKPDTQTAVGSLAIMRRPKAKDPAIAGNVVLLEMGFVSNDEDVVTVRQKAAYAIAKAVLLQLGETVPPEMDGQGPFADVSPAHYAADAINDMAEQGIMNGFGDGLFRPDEPLTRGQAALIAQRILQARDAQTKAKDPTARTYPRDRV